MYNIYIYFVVKYILLEILFHGKKVSGILL